MMDLEYEYNFKFKQDYKQVDVCAHKIYILFIWHNRWIRMIWTWTQIVSK